MQILVVNSGSSSIKCAVYNMQTNQLCLNAKIEKIGEYNSHWSYQSVSVTGETTQHIDKSSVADYTEALDRFFEHINSHKDSIGLNELAAIGHRVVHGGEELPSASVIDDKLIEQITAAGRLAPLHNPVNLAGIEAARRHYPSIPQVAVFDTAFFRQLPEYAFRYALPEELYRQHAIRRYGFHGTSHRSVLKQAAAYLPQALERLRIISLHLGNGASAAAIQNGICIDTSMGLTPLPGLFMGTRCGDLDPSVVLYLINNLNMTAAEIENLLNRESGMKGLCGAKDMREVHRLAEQGDQRALLAREMYCYQIKKYIGAYQAILGGLDVLIFTGGIGEHDPYIRQAICTGLDGLGIAIDDQLNRNPPTSVCSIKAKQSDIEVLLIPSNEALEIASETALLLTP